VDPKSGKVARVQGPAHSPVATVRRLSPLNVRLDRRLAAIGIAGGILSGLLGIGGGVIMIPLLVYWARYSQRDAHAASLGAIIPISLVGVATYGVAGKVRLGEAAALAVGSLVGARIGAGLLARLDERALKLFFGLFLVAVAVLMAVRR